MKLPPLPPKTTKLTNEQRKTLWGFVEHKLLNGSEEDRYKIVFCLVAAELAALLRVIEEDQVEHGFVLPHKSRGSVEEARKILDAVNKALGVDANG